MLATGSEDFADILVPLLTDKDREMRISAYQAGEDLPPNDKFLPGADRRRVVDAWDEDARVDFVYEVTHRGLFADIGESFAMNDPSAKVREQAIENLSWIGATDALTRIVDLLDDAALEFALPIFISERLPSRCARASLPPTAALWPMTPSRSIVFVACFEELN